MIIQSRHSSVNDEPTNAPSPTEAQMNHTHRPGPIIGGTVGGSIVLLALIGSLAILRRRNIRNGHKTIELSDDQVGSRFMEPFPPPFPGSGTRNHDNSEKHQLSRFSIKHRLGTFFQITERGTDNFC